MNDIRRAVDIWTAIRNSNTERLVGLSHIGYTLCKLVDDGLANIIANFGGDNPSKFVSMAKRLPKVSGLDYKERIPVWTAIGLKKCKEIHSIAISNHLTISAFQQSKSV